MAGLLEGRVALITGASQGSGRGGALEFAREGASCILVGRRLEPLERLAHEIETLGARALPLRVDVSRSRLASPRPPRPSVASTSS